MANKFQFYIQDMSKVICTDVIKRIYVEWNASLKDENIRVAEEMK